MKNKKVKQMICGILENKTANCEVSVRFIDGDIAVFMDGSGFRFNQGTAKFDSKMNPISNNKTSIIVSAVGSTVISICNELPATFDQSGYDELEFTETGLTSELKVE